MMGLFSDIVNDCSLAAQWVKDNPVPTAGIVLVATLAGIGLATTMISIAVATEVAYGLGIGLSVSLTAILINEGKEAVQIKNNNNLLRASNNDMLLNNAKMSVKLSTRKAIITSNQEALLQNSKTKKEDDDLISKLNTRILQKEANAPTLTKVVSHAELAPTEDVIPPLSPASTQGMFTNTAVRKRTTRHASNEPTHQINSNFESS